MVETPVLSYNAKYYNDKVKSNPEFYEKERRRVCEYIHNRYNNDEEYKQRFYNKRRIIIKKNKQERLEKEKLNILLST
jgi:hypothetical protein